MAFDVQTLTDAARCAECLSPNQKQNVLLYLLNGILENGAGGGGSALHNLLSLTHPDTVPGPPLRGSLIVGNATPDWEALLIGAANRVLRSDGVDATWSQLVLTTDVTGILPIANGGTNSSVALNNNRIMVSSGGAIVEAAALTNGQILIGSTGAAPVVASLTAGANISVTPGAGSITIAVTGVVTQAYSTIQEEGAALPQQSTLNFISAAITAADDPGNSRTNVTLAHSSLTKVDDTNVTLTLGGSPTTALLAATSLTLGWTGTLSPARGGTGTGTVFTQGSVIFAGAAGVFTEDNANFFWDDTNNRLGIGTTTPIGSLELSSNLFPSNNALVITLSNDTDTNFPNILYRRSRGTVASPTAPQANDRLGGFGFRGLRTTAYPTVDNAVFRVFAAENFSDIAHGTYFTFESTPIGGITRLERMRIDTFSISMSPTGTAAGRTNELRFLELAASGTNYTGFRASDAMAASEIYVLPNAAPAANRFLQAAAVAGGVSALSWAQVSLTADVTGILPVANGGSGTSTAFTQGSVIFAGPAGVYAQDNANFFWDDTNNWLGLGIAVPLSRLHMVSSAAATIVEIVRAAAAQSANLTEWQSSAAVANTVINAAGNINIPTTTSTVGFILQAGGRLLHSFGTNNFFLGVNSGNFTLTASNCCGVGVSTLMALTSANSCTAIGTNSCAVISSGEHCTGVGASTLQSNTIGIRLTAVGVDALIANVNGDGSTAVGWRALAANISGGYNIAIGYTALTSCTSSQNIGIGAAAGDNLISGSHNIIIGYDIDSPTAINSNTLTIGNLIFGAGMDGAGTGISSGGVGVGVITPTAKLHLRAGTTAASTAPLKFNTGTSMTAAETGAMEFTTDDLFFTITTGAARKRLLMADAVGGLTSGKIPIATTNGRLIDLTASAAYTPTNVTTDRAFDANATSVDELADVIGTIIADLQTKGILG